jgi:rod shape determining protein RodA
MDSVRDCFRLLRRLDPLFVLAMLLLLAAGCLFIYGTGNQAGGGFSHYWVRQLVWVGLGAVCFLVLCCANYQSAGRWAWFVYGIGIALLVLVLVAGERINQARSWLPAAFGVTLQPAELAKPATLLLVAWLASRRALRLNHGWHVLPLLFVAAVPVGLVGLQPDWGTAMVFVPLVLAIVFVAGLSWRWIAGGALLLAAAAYIGYQHALAPYQRERIRTFLQPSADITAAGWNAHQSLVAVGSGGLWGKGFMRGTQHVLGFLPRPVAPTDFIFSVVAEESGFIGAAAMVSAFIALLLGCFRAATVAADDFGAYLATGFAALLTVHAFVNIGMTIRMAPIIGIPLPFVSYGGSFMLSTMACAGLVQSVYVRRP